MAFNNTSDDYIILNDLHANATKSENATKTPIDPYLLAKNLQKLILKYDIKNSIKIKVYYLFIY